MTPAELFYTAANIEIQLMFLIRQSTVNTPEKKELADKMTQAVETLAPVANQLKLKQWQRFNNWSKMFKN